MKVNWSVFKRNVYEIYARAIIGSKSFRAVENAARFKTLLEVLQLLARPGTMREVSILSSHSCIFKSVKELATIFASQLPSVYMDRLGFKLDELLFAGQW